MKQIIFFILFITLFSACSFKTPNNNWQYKSSNAFSSYTKNFLSSNDLMAQNDLKRAIEHAKVSSNLTTLARIYLGECALNISVGIKDNCTKYKEISDVVNSSTLDAYYSLLNLNIEKNQIQYLPKKYQNFALSILNKDFKKANINLNEIEDVTSKLLSAALIKDKLNTKNIKTITELASFNGYKKSVLFWLDYQTKTTIDKDEKRLLIKKINILKGNNDN